MSNILRSEKIHVDKQILLNNGYPFNSIKDVHTYLDNMKSKLGEHMFIYDYNNLSEVLLNEVSFKIFNDEISKLNGDESNILHFYKIIGKRVFITEETVNTKTSKIINYPYASCIIGLYKPNNTKDFLFQLSKNKKIYLNTEYTLLSHDIKLIDDESIKNLFVKWLSETVNNKEINLEKLTEPNTERN
jgi:hypothetical protein